MELATSLISWVYARQTVPVTVEDVSVHVELLLKMRCSLTWTL